MTKGREQFMEMQFEIETLKADLEKMRERKDGAYAERNNLVAALAHIFPAGVAKTAIEGWDEEWHNCVYIDTPVGQLSWHYHDSQAMAFMDLPPYTGTWDGHTTEEKYARLAKLAAMDIMVFVTHDVEGSKQDCVVEWFARNPRAAALAWEKKDEWLK